MNKNRIKRCFILVLTFLNHQRNFKLILYSVNKNMLYFDTLLTKHYLFKLAYVIMPNNNVADYYFRENGISARTY